MTLQVTPSKYRAVRTIVDGIEFASKKEAKRYSELRLLERAGLITGLKLQPAFELIVNGTKVGRYTPDFQYTELKKANYSAPAKNIVEDVKGYIVRDYPLRKKLFCALYPEIAHREI